MFDLTAKRAILTGNVNEPSIARGRAQGLKEAGAEFNSGDIAMIMLSQGATATGAASAIAGYDELVARPPLRRSATIGGAAACRASELARSPIATSLHRDCGSHITG